MVGIILLLLAENNCTEKRGEYYMKFKNIIAGIILCSVFMLGAVGCKNDNDNGTPSAGSETTVAEYKDGEYIASASNYDDQGFKATVKVTVKDGRVATVDCDAMAKDGDTKKVQSENGTYSMKSGGAEHEWHEQMAYFEKHIVENGVDSVAVKGDSKTDTVTGCTVKVKEYVELINEALKKAEK